MNPAESIEKALREHLRIRPQERAIAALKAGEPILVTGREAEEGAEIALKALEDAGLVVVSAEDLRVYLYRGKDLKAEVAAMNRLRAALPEGTTDHG